MPSSAAPASGLRRALDTLYSATAGLAAVFMVGLLVMVLLSIVGRQLHFNVPGVDAYAGYMMAGAGFLALAHTLKQGEHIRVTLLVTRFTGQARRRIELWALAAASCLGVLMAIYSCKLAWQSHVYHDISTANDATPLWLPQLSMALGSVVFAIGLIDEFVRELLDLRPLDGNAEAQRHE